VHELISVRLTGHDAEFALDEDAYADLRGYLDDASTRLLHNLDRDEIVGDLERSIGDRLRDMPSATSDRISATEMRAVLNAVGDVDREDANQSRPARISLPPRGRFWCRIKQGDWFGGICLGIAAYGDFRVDASTGFAPSSSCWDCSQQDC
jgi:hypothetical protein